MAFVGIQWDVDLNLLSIEFIKKIDISVKLDVRCFTYLTPLKFIHAFYVDIYRVDQDKYVMELKILKAVTSQSSFKIISNGENPMMSIK